MPEQKIILKAKAHLLEVSEVDDALFNTIAKFSGDESVQQEDLLHVRSVLVTTGANENQDVFTKSELWAARKSPLHKPSDWDHDRTRIIGHMYHVEAKTLDGQELDLDADEPTLTTGEPYDGDFELVVDEVIYAYLLPEYAAKIKETAARGELFVSMEVWFKSYDYGVWENKDNATKRSVSVLSTSIDTISRDDNLHMERFLRTAGGEGRLEDGRLIGRVLKDMVFGGKGFVGVPANPRSIIENVGEKGNTDDLANEVEEEVGLLQSVTANLEETMSTENVEHLEARIKELEGQLETLEQENADLKASAATEALEKSQASRSKRLDDVLRAVAATPAEIARIDEVISRGGDADELFDAKLSWLSETASAFKARAEDAESKVLSYRTAERFEQVKALDIYSEARLEKVKEQIGSMTDEEFGEWLEERQELADSQRELREQLVASDESAEEEVKEDDEASKSEGSEDEPAEAALEALANAEEEEKPDLEGTEAQKEEDVDVGMKTLVELTTKGSSERRERLRKRREKFGC